MSHPWVHPRRMMCSFVSTELWHLNALYFCVRLIIWTGQKAMCLHELRCAQLPGDCHRASSVLPPEGSRVGRGYVPAQGLQCPGMSRHCSQRHGLGELACLSELL